MTERLVLGLGGTVDYEIEWDSSVVEHLIEEYAIDAVELSHAMTIASERDLVRSLLAFMTDGVGGERFVASSDIVDCFASRFHRRITLGGTCVRAAFAMEKLGVSCLLHLVSIDDHVRRMLPASSTYITSAVEDSTDPHLIVQFGAGVRVGARDIEFITPHPNRVIFANDPPNRELRISDQLGSALRAADVFMIAGFNVIQDPGLLNERLVEIREHMRQLPNDALVFYEDSGFHIPALSLRVRDALIDTIDVYSLNEDEMQAYLGRRVDLLDAEEMVPALRQLQALIPVRTLVVHTKYWSLALGDEASDYAAALQGGITMASTRYVYGDEFTAADYRTMEAFPRHPGGVVFADGLQSRLGHAVCCLSAFVLETERPTTIGLGDTFVGGFVAALARCGPDAPAST